MPYGSGANGDMSAMVDKHGNSFIAKGKIQGFIYFLDEFSWLMIFPYPSKLAACSVEFRRSISGGRVVLMQGRLVNGLVG